MNAVDLLLDPSRMEAAVSRIAELMGEAKEPLPNEQHEVADFPAATSFGELLEEYDYGEPLWNGWLMLLAKHLLVSPPSTIQISNIEELAEVDSEYISRFHHGDVIVDGDLGVFDSTWITGNLQVGGVIDASYLDAYQDLHVGGNVRCRAIQMMGLSMIAGTLECDRFAYVHSQGENWVLGGVKAPCLIGEWESVEAWDSTNVTHRIDLDDDEMESLAKLLGVSVEPNEEDAFMIVLRALDAARVA